VSIYLKTGRVKSEWTDYNGHMNLAFYIHLFDSAWEVLLQKFNIGEDAAKIEKRTTFAVESHTTYDMEVKVGDEVDINLLFIDFDKKRIVYKLEMIHKSEKYLAATTEVCSLYVDLNSRKVTEFEESKSNLIKNFIEDNKNNFKPGNLHLINKLKK
jgi:acyl-CoA thioester hydrolase|tara:strand:- start:240 stop:707 length:468 start_codon:yes stop_codon:yes gene_type:complete